MDDGSLPPLGEALTSAPLPGTLNQLFGCPCRSDVLVAPAAFMRLGSASDTPQNEEHAREVFGYWSKDDTELLVIRTGMRDLLEEQNFSPSVVLPEWAAAGSLVRDDTKNVTAKRMIAGIRDRFFVVPTTFLDRSGDERT